MNHIVICPYCKKELALFQSQIERRRGRIKCIGCGTAIPYDLERRTRPRRIITPPGTHVGTAPGEPPTDTP